MNVLPGKSDGPMVGAARGIGDGPEPECCASSPRPVSTTRAANIPRKPLGEKERVYSELHRLREKCKLLREEVKTLRAATTAEEAAAARLEARRYKKALSNIAYRLANGGILAEDLQSIVSDALLLKGLRARDRRRIARANEKERGDG